MKFSNLKQISVSVNLLLLSLLVCWFIPTVICEHPTSFDQNGQIFLFRFFEYFDQVRKNISQECRYSYDYFRNHSREQWALNMIDANSVVEPGLVDGNLQFFGAFDECIGLKIPVNQSLSTRKNSGQVQYCTVQFPLSIILNKNESKQYPSYILRMVPPTAGICLPAACTAQHDLPLILDQLSKDHNGSFGISDCITKDQLDISNRIEPLHMVILSIFILIILITIIGTILQKVHQFNSQQIRQSKNVLLKFFLCFDLERNLQFLFSTLSPKTKKTSIGQHQKAPQIDCLHGIRVLSFLFILIYHTFTEAQVPSANLLEILDAEQNFFYQLITNAALWVDTFFLLSGFLMAHGALHQTQSNETKASTIRQNSLWQTLYNHPQRILHRYVRLTPSVAGIVGVSILIEVIGSGPLWNNYVQLSRSSCHKNWWNLFLYVNNICNLNSPTNPQRECLSYLWYLAVDMQLFIVSPLLIMFLVHESSRMQTIGVLLNYLVILGSWVLTAFLITWNHLTPTVLVTVYDLNYINQVYKASYCRIGPYSVGVLLAYYLRKRNIRAQQECLVHDEEDDEQSIHKQPVDENNNHLPNENKTRYPVGNYQTGFMLFFLSMVILLAVTLLTYPWLQGTNYQNAPSILYGSIHRTVWAFAWALFIWALARNHLPLINRFFSCGLLKMLSKLTYQSYLLHSVLISALINSVRQKIYFSSVNFALDVISYFFLTQIISVITYLMFERPFINIESIFLINIRTSSLDNNKNRNNVPSSNGQDIICG